VTAINELLQAAAADLPDNPALVEQVLARGRRHRRRTRIAAGCAAAVVLAGGGAVAVTATSHVPTGRITIGATPGLRPPSPHSTGTRNLVVDDAVRGELATAWAAGQHLRRSDVAGTKKGSVFYAYDGPSRTYWAVANFEPSLSALTKHRRLNGASGDPTIQFQDGPFILRGPVGGAWTLVGDTGGAPICQDRVPATVIAAWQLHAC
jgi:hypothetical protein